MSEDRARELWATYVGDPEEAGRTFDDAYLGSWGSVREWADDYLDGIGAHAALDGFGPSVNVDVGAFVRDCELGGDLVAEFDGGVYHLFNPNAV